MRHRFSFVLLAATLTLVLPACGGGGGGGSPTTPATPAPSQAQIAVFQAERGTIGFSPSACCNFRILIPLRIVESGGLGANVNFARLSIIRSGVEVERQEIGSDVIIAAVGTNRLNANQTLDVTLFFDFNSFVLSDDFLLLINFTDERGNVSNDGGTLDGTDFDFVPAIII